MPISVVVVVSEEKDTGIQGKTAQGNVGTKLMWERGPTTTAFLIADDLS